MLNTVRNTDSADPLVAAIASVLRSLFADGWHLESVRRETRKAAHLCAKKYDLFGCQSKYLLFIASESQPQNVLKSFRSEASRQQRFPLTILYDNGKTCESSQTYTLNDFLEKLGGSIDTNRIMRPDIANLLKTIGHNQPYDSLIGEPQDLLEEYTKDCLQYILGQRARRFGSDRLFESLPDGVAFGRNKLSIYFDAKAYSDGYKLKSDDILRFASYVDDYNKRYAKYLGPIFAFVVTSGTFKMTARSMNNKAGMLYAKCMTQLTFVESEELGCIVNMLMQKQRLLTTLDWASILSHRVLEMKLVQKDLERVRKDGLI
ncbi:MAG: hypothetical protein NT011_06970 [Kiritimatiellaeota bacterium]|nr:hypothetical protein [Kiritimatiellota bacterium]